MVRIHLLRCRKATFLREKKRKKKKGKYVRLSRLQAANTTLLHASSSVNLKVEIISTEPPLGSTIVESIYYLL